MIVTILVAAIGIGGPHPLYQQLPQVIVYQNTNCVQLGKMVRNIMKEWNSSLPPEEYARLDQFECYDNIDTSKELKLFDGSSVMLNQIFQKE